MERTLFPTAAADPGITAGSLAYMYSRREPHKNLCAVVVCLCNDIIMQWQVWKNLCLLATEERVARVAGAFIGYPVTHPGRMQTWRR